MELRTWMEILRVVSSTPGISIHGLSQKLQGTTIKGLHRLTLAGYVHCMEDVGLLRTESHPPSLLLYSNGAHLSDILQQYGEFQRLIEEKLRNQKEKMEAYRLDHMKKILQTYEMDFHED